LIEASANRALSFSITQYLPGRGAEPGKKHAGGREREGKEDNNTVGVLRDLTGKERWISDEKAGLKNSWNTKRERPWKEKLVELGVKSLIEWGDYGASA